MPYSHYKANDKNGADCELGGYVRIELHVLKRYNY